MTDRIRAVRPVAAGRQYELAHGRQRDVIALAGLFLLTLVGIWPLVADRTIVGQDSLTFHFTAYTFLGDRLQELSLPVWNPYWFGGAPFAADPESGWMYVPAMLLFSILKPALAIESFFLLHLLLAGFGAYALARLLGMGAGAAAVAAIAFEFTGAIYNRLPCCPAYYQVSAWVPMMLIAAECALRAQTWRRRLGWWLLGGFSLSQVLAVWLGQGAIYAGMLLAGFLAYRIVFDPPDGATRLRERAANLVLHGGVIMLLTFGLAAAGLLPRLEFHARSNMADGYVGNLAWAARLGGWDLESATTALLSASLYDIGGATAALALLGLLTAGRQFAAPFFGGISVLTLAFSSNTVTRWSETIPIIGELHPHYPERVTMVGAIGPAMLAGAAVAAAPRRPKVAAVVAAAASLAVLAILLRDQTVLDREDNFRIAAMTGVVVVAVTLLRHARLRFAAPAIISLLLFADLYSAAATFRTDAPYGGYARVDTNDYVRAEDAAAFLQSRDGEARGRFFGYDPELRGSQESRDLYYRYHWNDPRAQALLVNNRATVLGIEDVQGYNPLQLQRYVEFMDAVNGQAQEYHGANVLESGIESPLLDLVGARYVVIPAGAEPDRTDLAWLRERFPEVYRDEQVIVLENRDAFPRAWLVHEARSVGAGEALPLLQSGSVDPRQVAVIEGAAPPVSLNPSGEADEVTILDESPQSLRLRVTTGAPTLLVVGVNNYPSWQATVDGEAAKIYPANHIQLAVAVPAGEHVVELGHQSRTLQLGLGITSLTIGGTGLTLVMGSILSGVRNRSPIRARVRRAPLALPGD